MSGLRKQQHYDWKDSNLALFGSDVEKQVKKTSAEQEKAWKGAGTKVGLQIWRIVNFKVTDWPTEEYGKFFGGDSYIILHTYKADAKTSTLSYDLHFWIGRGSTQDEYGTAAYKTVELDTYLDDKPVQHREVQGYESDLFNSYFPKGIIVMEGGAESGFRHVTPATYKPRLLHVCGEKKHVVVRQVPMSRSRVNSGDVYILDLGETLLQWNGKGANKDERFKGMEILNKLKSERPKAHAETLDEDSTPSNHQFYTSLTEADSVCPSLSFHTHHAHNALPHELYRISDAVGGKLKFSKVKVGSVSMKDLDRMDVFILDTGRQCFVWVGSGASPAEKRNGFTYAHNHLMKTNHPLVPIIVVKDGQHNSDFRAAVAA